ncbi:unnamed protein product [Schistosoma curassoni]|uniref:ABC transporter permease n=1 Tax=Schistosoma curassoni TaxID=6186 RepID=A0A183KMP7_9TREM|nr:unnamed protein product [Schistosoma curassoni]
MEDFYIILILKDIHHTGSIDYGFLLILPLAMIF